MKYAICPDCTKLVFAKNASEKGDREAMKQDKAPKFAVCKKCVANKSAPTICSSKSRPSTSDERRGGWE